MRIRLMLSFALVVLVTIASLVFFFQRTTVREVEAFMVRGSMVGVNEIAADLEAYYNQHGSWDGLNLTDTLFAGQGQNGRGLGGMMGSGGANMMGQRLRVAAADGVVFLDSRSESVGSSLNSQELQSSVVLHDQSGLKIGYLLAEGGSGAQLGDQTFLVTRLNQAAFNAALIAGAISLALALLLAYTLLRPVDHLSKAAKALAGGDMSQRVPAGGSGEMAELGRTFNTMADSLQQAELSRRAMTADIAHELRTPLSVQRAQIEALQDGIDPLTPESLRSLLEQNELLARLVDDLRTLALADAGELRLEFTSADFPTVARRVVERFRPQAAAQNITLAVDEASGGCPPTLMDTGRIEQILSNLLSNALRYTPAGGAVTAAVRCEAGFVELRLRDSGPGIPAEALPHVFERFYRSDRARSRDKGGSGLGLAIARQLALSHGGSLSAANGAQGGAEFTLSLPVRQA